MPFIDIPHSERPFDSKCLQSEQHSAGRIVKSMLFMHYIECNKGQRLVSTRLIGSTKSIENTLLFTLDNINGTFNGLDLHVCF